MKKGKGYKDWDAVTTFVLFIFVGCLLIFSIAIYFDHDYKIRELNHAATQVQNECNCSYCYMEKEESK